MLNLLIRSLSPIIYAKQTTTSLAHLVSPLVLYFPLRINKANPSNWNNTEFLASAGTNSCNHKTLSHAITKNIIFAHFLHTIQGWMIFTQKCDSCGKPSWLSITHIRQCLGRNEEKCPDCLLAQLNWNWWDLALQWLPRVKSIISGM